MKVDLDNLRERLESFVQPFLEKRNVFLVDMELTLTSAQVVIEILVDTPEGINLGVCASLNRDIGAALEEINIIESPYTLGVSSPGLDRLLKTKQDFIRKIGLAVHLFLLEAVDGRKEYVGKIKNVVERSVVLECDKFGEKFIPLDVIYKAKPILDLLKD